MRVGVRINRFDHPGGGPALAAGLGAAGAAAEEAGVSWLSVMDHWFQMDFNGRAEDPMLEACTTLGHLAARTSTVRLGVLVTGVTYRHPGLPAKTVTTPDVLSGGRATPGIGAAWYEREHAGPGVPFPPLAERFERLEETLRICPRTWDPEENGPFEGAHYRLAETLCVPPPVSRPRPGILVGGGGERRTLRPVARYADACDLFADSAEEVARKPEVLRGHCAAEGRDYDAVRKTVLYTVDPADRGRWRPSASGCPGSPGSASTR